MPPRPRVIRPSSPFLHVSLALGLCGCAQLEKEPWSRTAQGSHSLALLTGTALYQAELDVQGQDGPIAGLTDSAESDLQPQFGLQLEYGYFVVDNFSVGAAFGLRRFDPDPVEIFGAGFDGDTFTSTHFFLTTRYYLPPFGAERRWRPLVGLDLGYVPEVSLDATVDYGGGFTEQVQYDGDSFWKLGLRAALACLLTDRLAFEFGAFYELPLSTSDATLTLDIPGAGPSQVSGEIRPSGFVFYLGLSYGF
jgi:hypothetical protein